MRPPRVPVTFPSEVSDFSDEVRRVFLELGRVFGPESLAGECAPSIDVLETDDGLEIAMDLPGVDPAAIRIIAKGDGILIAGEKVARRARRIQLSSRRARLWTLCPRGAPRASVRHVEGAGTARRRRTARLGAEARRPPQQGDSHRDHVVVSSIT
jgi:hypothetical protein